MSRRAASPPAHPSRDPSPSLSISLSSLPQRENKIKEEHNILLLDHSRPAASRAPTNDQLTGLTNVAEEDDSDAPPTPGPGTPLYKRLTATSTGLQQSVSGTVRKQITNQKYGKYRRHRYADDEDTSRINSTTSAFSPDEAPRDVPQQGAVAAPTQVGALEGRKAKKQSRWHRKKKQLRGEDIRDQVIDILYENQRGAFLFGIPNYSSSSLLPSDPRPWQNAEFRTSPVDIRNAQVPDPSWEWVWKQWYVDMSRDVDEEGWEYTLIFPGPIFGRWAWHGTHPWFHSFVRRRRWVRLRRRKTPMHRAAEKAHELTAEYFTIRPKTLRAGTESGGRTLSRSTSWARMHAKMEDESSIEKTEILSIADLLHALRKAGVDREKLVLVRKFVANGGEELHYLSGRMEEVMHLLMYQSSRRRLLADLISHHEDAHRSREDLRQHNHDDVDQQARHEAAERQADNLHRAVLEAERLVKGLEYWSDIKSMAHTDERLHHQVVGDTGKGFSRSAFNTKQKASEGMPQLHSHPEHPTSTSTTDNGENGNPMHKESSKYFDAPTSPPSSNPHRASSNLTLLRSPVSFATADDDDGTKSLDHYLTAQESASDTSTTGRLSPRNSKSALSPAQKGKEKAAKLSSLDGLMDEVADEEADEKAHEAFVREMLESGGGGNELDGEMEGVGTTPKAIGSPRSEEGEVVERENA
ncbi:hypothetical protein B0A50_08196 [Salinomyces thailandicus]|uniref:Peroxin/Ferlin domain-containing protein n=1 Tax=Salinomyces thailandicus TaxID=706561 RepID=A0A4V5N337_9PEZI|nr:hypothetical protein B0A50_08196 [Salinomyces thailandica]